MINKLKALLNRETGLIRISKGFGLLALCTLALIVALYFAITYIDPIRHFIQAEEVNNQEVIKEVQETDTNSPQESESKKTIISEIASIIKRSESSIYDEMHQMVNTRIVADEIWGEIEITEKRVEALINEISRSDYTDRDILLDMLNNWKMGDFSKAVEEHNYLWDQLDGTVGRAYGLRKEENDATEVIELKAVYFISKYDRQLTEDDLDKYTEVIITDSFEKLKALTDKKIAIWIDKKAIDEVDQEWLQKAPQKDYPIVLVGYNDAVYSFREKLGGFGIHGPKIDWETKKLEPGFSVWKLKEETSSSRSAFMKGYETTPSVQAILDVTNMLLEDRYPDE